jgi:hypothetical protein
MTTAPKRVTVLASIIAALAVVLAAGGWSLYRFLSPTPTKVTMNAAQAKNKAEQLLDDTLSALRPTVACQPDYPQAVLNHTGADSTYDGTARVLVTRDLSTAVSNAKLGVLVNLVAQRWKQRGYRVNVNHASNGVPSAEADTADGDHLSVRLIRAGTVSVQATVGTFQGPAKEIDGDWVYGKPHQIQLDANGNAVFPPLKNDPYWSR